MDGENVSTCGVTEAWYHRIIEVGSGLWRPSGPTIAQSRSAQNMLLRAVSC